MEEGIDVMANVAQENVHVDDRDEEK